MVSINLYAGTNVGLRDNNEDNFIVCPDITQNEWIVPADASRTISLGKEGCVMVVADGMGGQNAGEVASAIAVDVVQHSFGSDKKPSNINSTPENAKEHLKRIIIEADVRIKKRTKEEPDTSGMGSTIVIAWLIGKKLYVAWLGDSRAYSFIPGKGIGRLSKDHSYVQQLVDDGKLTDLQAMHHPNSNIITKSLGDTSQKAKPDVVEHDVVDGEVILLCSDGLCGTCQDEVIGGIIEDNAGNLQKCKEALTDAALSAGSSDNITISLLQVHYSSNQEQPKEEDTNPSILQKKNQLTTFLSALGLIVLCGLAFWFCNRTQSVIDKVSIKLSNETIDINSTLSYQVNVEGTDSAYMLTYDDRILLIDDKHHKISLNRQKGYSKDTVVFIHAVSSCDSTKSDSAKLVIKAVRKPEPEIIEKPDKKILEKIGKELNAFSKKDSILIESRTDSQNTTDEVKNDKQNDKQEKTI